MNRFRSRVVLCRLALALGLLLTQGLFAGGLLRPDEFAHRYRAYIETAYPGVSSDVTGPLEVSVRYGDGWEVKSFLDNAYSEYKIDPEALDQIIENYASALMDRPRGSEVQYDKSSLVPMVKPNAYVDEWRALVERNASPAAPPPDELHVERLNRDLVVLYAFDSEHSLRFATRQDLEEVGVFGQALRELAIGNLVDRLPDITVEGNDSLSMLVAGGNFEASLLLLDEIWTKENFNVRGDIVVFVPARDVVLVTGSQDEEGLSTAEEIVAGNEWPHMISPVGFVRRGLKWNRFEP
jgi:uncharacterized protein YtpQ (UPF0354 family)